MENGYTHQKSSSRERIGIAGTEAADTADKHATNAPIIVALFGKRTGPQLASTIILR